MVEQTTQYGMSITVTDGYERTAQRTREELAKEGFGVLTEIDVAATLQKKIGVGFRPYVILGACNPGLAHRALSTELDIGLLLPCNVIVYEGSNRGTTVVAAMDPVAAMGLAGNEMVRPIAEEVKSRLKAVLTAVERSSNVTGHPGGEPPRHGPTKPSAASR